MTQRRISDAVARPVRTTMQGGVGLILAQFVDAWIYDMNDVQMGSLVALLTIVLSWVQPLVEDRIGTGLMRDVPSREVPVVDNEKNEGGYSTGELVLLLLAAVGVVLIILALTDNLN